MDAKAQSDIILRGLSPIRSLSDLDLRSSFSVPDSFLGRFSFAFQVQMILVGGRTFLSARGIAVRELSIYNN